MLSHPAFRPPPELGQFARDGVWETAWSFPRSASLSRGEIEAYLAGGREVAFEAFFGDAFFGLRFRGEPREAVAFACSCVAALRAATDGGTFFSRLSENMSLDGWGQSLAFAEVGAVNAWQSVGPFRIPAPAHALADFDAVWAALEATPLAGNASFRKAVELAYCCPLPHWFALPVSASRPPFALSRDKLREALEAASGWGPSGDRA